MWREVISKTTLPGAPNPLLLPLVVARGAGPVEEDGESGAGHAPGLGGVAKGEVRPRQPRNPLHRDDDGVVLRTVLINIIL